MVANSYWLVVALLLLLFLWAAWMFYKYPSWALALLLPLLAWLLFDPLVFALGNALGEGSTLQVLSYLRYLLRALATPFLLLLVWDQAQRARVKATGDPLLLLALGLVILGLIVFGVVSEFVGINLEPVEQEGLKQYRPETPLGVPWAGLITLGLCAVLGVGVLLKTRTPWLLLGILLLLLGRVFVLPTISSAVMAATSVAFVLGVLLTEVRLHKIAPNPAAR